MRRRGADCPVVVTKRGECSWSEGGRSSPLGASQLATGGAPILDGRRQPSCGGTSRMTRECQVRICERLGVKFPGPTRPFETYRLHRAMSEFESKAENICSQRVFRILPISGPHVDLDQHERRETPFPCGLVAAVPNPG